MTWYARITATPAGPLAAGTTGLILVDASAGPIAITLPVSVTAGPIWFARKDASANAVTISVQAGDVIFPAAWNAPVLSLGAGESFGLVGGPDLVWRKLESAIGVMIREAAVAAIIGYGTIAGSDVESERVDGVASGDMPRVIVFADETAISASKGGWPSFEVTLTLSMHCLVERAAKADAVRDLDTLAAQVRDALLADPVWPTLPAEIGNIRTARSFKPEGERIVGEARVTVECSWTESYVPRVVTPLDTVTVTTNPPAGTQAVEIEMTFTP
ncbi:MAG: hypothetical protein KGH75_01080 [Rhodospirillales bacterium]|nr:hypothetical protein [Rhodospirillales bacterium]